MALHTPKEKHEHIYDYIERMAATDSGYAIAFSIVSLKQSLEDLSVRHRNTDDSATGELGHSLREIGSSIAVALDNVAAAIEHVEVGGVCEVTAKKLNTVDLMTESQDQ